MYLLNAFSANMLADFPVSVNFTEIPVSEARLALLLAAEEADEPYVIASAVGHADTAAVFGAALGVHVACCRLTLSMSAGERAILGQYNGPRLPEGATTLPDGASIRWLMVEVGEVES